MAMACCEPQFLDLNEAIKETEVRKQKTESGDTNAPIEDHVQKDNTEEDYDSQAEWNNGFILEEHIQEDNDEDAKKEKEQEEKGEKVDYDSDEDWNNWFLFDPNIKRVRCFANESIKWYNRQTGARYKLKRVLEATASWCTGFSYEITFIAEEGGSDDEPDEPALEYLKWVDEGDEKVVYNSGDDKPSDKSFEGVVYWKLPVCSLEVISCEIKTKQEVNKDNTEEAKDDECNTIRRFDSLKAYNRQTKKKRIRTSRSPRNLKLWKDVVWFHQCIQMNKKLRIFWLALGICLYYIIWTLLTKAKE